MEIDGLVSAFVDRAEGAAYPPPRATEFSPSLPDADDAAGDTATAPVAERIGAAVAIAYVDSRGQASRRRITIKSVEEDGYGDLTIRAYCHERRAARHFKASRIEELIDLETGEVAADPVAAIRALAFIDSSGAPNPKSDTTAEVLKANHDALCILAFLARCDGEYHASEDDVIAQFLLDRAFDVDFDGDAAMGYVRRLYPDPETVCEAVAALAAERPEELVAVARFAKLLIEADGVIVDEEVEFALALADALNEAVKPYR